MNTIEILEEQLVKAKETNDNIYKNESKEIKTLIEYYESFILGQLPNCNNKLSINLSYYGTLKIMFDGNERLNYSLESRFDFKNQTENNYIQTSISGFRFDSNKEDSDSEWIKYISTVNEKFVPNWLYEFNSEKKKVEGKYKPMYINVDELNKTISKLKLEQKESEINSYLKEGKVIQLPELRYYTNKLYNDEGPKYTFCNSPFVLNFQYGAGKYDYETIKTLTIVSENKGGLTFNVRYTTNSGSTRDIRVKKQYIEMYIKEYLDAVNKSNQIEAEYNANPSNYIIK